MVRPWLDVEVWKRYTAFFAVILILSAGFCGTNYWAIRFFQLTFSGGTINRPHEQLKEAMSMVLIMTALLELLGTVVGAGGLVVSLAGLLIAILSRKRTEQL